MCVYDSADLYTLRREERTLEKGMDGHEYECRYEYGMLCECAYEYGQIEIDVFYAHMNMNINGYGYGRKYR